MPNITSATRARSALLTPPLASCPHLTPQFHFLAFSNLVYDQGGCPVRTTLTATPLLTSGWVWLMGSCQNLGNQKESGEWHWVIYSTIGLPTGSPSWLHPSTEGHNSIRWLSSHSYSFWFPVIVPIPCPLMPRLSISQDVRKTVAPQIKAMWRESSKHTLHRNGNRLLGTQ